jgi:hypothetical protein
MNSKLKQYIVLLVVSAILFSCKESEPLRVNTSNANVRFWNSIPDIRTVAGLDFTIDGVSKGTIVYKQDIPSYLQTQTGERILDFFASGTTQLALQERISFDENENYTVIIGDSAARLDTRSLQDDLPSTVKLDSAATCVIRLLHLSPNTPPVEIGVIDSNRVITTVFRLTPFLMRDDSLVQRTAFRNFRLNAPSRSLNLVALDTVGRRDTIPLGIANLNEKEAYSLIIRGFLGGTNPQALEFVTFREK